MDGGAVLQTLVLSLGVLALVGAVVWHAIDTLWSRRLTARREVLVQLRSGNAVRGVMWARKGRTLVVKGATWYEPGAEPAQQEGSVLLDRDAAECKQVLG